MTTDSMTIDTSEEFRDSARDFLGRGDHLRRTRELRSTASGFDREMWRSIADAGWLSVLLPSDLGGLDLGLREIAAIGEEAGAHLLPEPFVAAGVQFPTLLSLAPGSELKSQLAAALSEGRLIAGLAWQEQPGQNDTDPIDAGADDDGQHVILNGRKQFVYPGSGADGWAVSAMRAGRMGLFWVSADTAGVSLHDERRIDGSVMATLTLDGVRIPASDMLIDGDAASEAIAAANDAARIAQGAELIGVARRAL